MRLAVSTIALPQKNQAAWLPKIAEMGFAGVEVSPAWTWGTGCTGPSNAEVTAFRQSAQQAGLEIVGLHSLLQGQTGMGFFQGSQARQSAVEFVVLMSQVCRDLGGRTLVLGGERFRGDLDDHSAWAELLNFLEGVLPRIENHGTLLCLDPLEPVTADFCHRAADCRMLIGYVDHPALGYQLDSAVIAANGDAGHTTFAALRGKLDVFHVAEPDLLTLGASQQIDHADFRRHLASISFREWLCLHQQAGAEPANELESSLRVLRHYYLRRDNLSLERLRQEAAAVKATAQFIPQPIQEKTHGIRF
ncbi:sugar phosphate isomerase/epimerase family protein [Methylobacter sp.]|uniref:sugar phosphate isomerase/epimerase family protein n=1 Tax=Methylobacter sp. TaxID=2051955 RepID=UPI002FDEE78C